MALRPLALVLLAAALATAAAAQAPDSLGRPVYETAEVPPELVGGLAAVARAAVYPESARAAGLEGTVVVQFVVDERGAVTRPVVVRSPGEALSRAALDAVRQQRFRPGREGGAPVRVVFTLPVTFRLAAPDGPAAADAGSGGGVDPLYECASTPDDPVVAGGLAALRDRLERLGDAGPAAIRSRVVAGFTVDVDGRPIGIEVDRPLPPAVGRGVVRTVEGARFQPAQCEGRPMRSRFVVPFLLPTRALAADSAAGGGPEGTCRTWEEPDLDGVLAEIRRLVRYPNHARVRGVEGEVIVQTLVDERGRPTEVELVRSVHPSLDQAALVAVQRARFVPARCDGEPHAFRLAVPVSFRLVPY